MKSEIGIYQHIQTTPSTVWTIEHNLGVQPIHDIWVIDGGVYSKIYPANVVHIDDNTLQLTFSSPQTGQVRLVGYSNSNELAPLIPPPWLPFNENFLTASFINGKVFDDVVSSSWKVFEDDDYDTNMMQLVQDLDGYWKFVDSRSGSNAYGSLPSSNGVLISMPSTGYTVTGSQANAAWFEVDLDILPTLADNKHSRMSFNATLEDGSKQLYFSLISNDPAADIMGTPICIVTVGLDDLTVPISFQYYSYSGLDETDFTGQHTWRIELHAGSVILKKDGVEFARVDDTQIQPSLAQNGEVRLDVIELTYADYSTVSIDTSAPKTGVIRIGGIRGGDSH